MSWLRHIGRKLTGAEAREREAEAAALRAEAEEIIAEHELRDDFAYDEARQRLHTLLGPGDGEALLLEHVKQRLNESFTTVLADGLLTPDEEEYFANQRRRYGDPGLDDEANRLLDEARRQYAAWTVPLEAVETPLLLKKNEWCVHAVQAEALEGRQRTVRTNYHGPSARLRLAKGIYYNAGSIAHQSETQGYHHSFGLGVLGATNTRLLWVSPSKSLNIPLGKIVLFEPFTDGIKVIRDTGKPVLFHFADDDRAHVVRISRVIEELRA